MVTTQADERQRVLGVQKQFREDIRECLRQELLGPSAPDELLGESPSLRYLMGRLAPAGTSVAAEEDEGTGDGGDDAESDAGSSAPPILAMNPASLGLSVVVSPGVDTLRAIASWGHYQDEAIAQDLDIESSAPGDEDVEASDEGAPHKRTRKGHRRQHVEQDPELAISTDGQLDLGTSIFLEWVVRVLDDGRRAVSVFLVNRREASNPDRPRDDEWIFQPTLRLEGVDRGAVFEPRVLLEGALANDPDLKSAELVYWNRPEFAVGHGCAADWHPPKSRQAIDAVWSSLFPAYELPRVDPREDVPATLDMRKLGGSGPEGVDADELEAMLRPLVEAYREWVDELRTQDVPDVVASLRETAEDHVGRCEVAATRIAQGIELIVKDDQVRQAFCFANRAMALQRERSQISLARRRGDEEPTSVAARWRPFQLAFILLNLNGLADRGHNDRTVADLLWFPTGGGKTEAYLGLTAFALAYRRLRTPLAGYRTDAGVTVLMRYTLRLLTLQQFQRATTLMCACEYLRREEGPHWGGQPFSIGMWVGQSATPNNYPDAREALKRVQEGLPTRKGSPVQLVSCPWCGEGFTPGLNYRADDDREQIFVWCTNSDCEFSSTRTLGLPVHVVDDEIYRHVPSLVIATVDKFARMPWKGHVQSLFGRVERHCPRHGYLSPAERGHANTHAENASVQKSATGDSLPLEPPELIIQDELHLISGPLGTLVGIYETAVDILSSARVDDSLVPPKVIASTATIRRATAQVSALFQRKLQIFPPQGLDAADSWFGKEVKTDDAPGRLYVGIYAPGKSVKTALVRVYAALLSRAETLRDQDAAAADAYMTLVGYFNSLRELGGALRLVEDDIPGRIRVLKKRDPGTWSSRNLFEREELTSNKRAEQVPEILAKLERAFTDGKPEPGHYPVDTVLASNMISVGVDIDRLGLMVVNGQPKTTAEYIQATSRVGRQQPGLVVTVYNWTRPRDISHFERFRSYHHMLYRFVEATSVTPFSSRARDRALDGVLTGLVRLGNTDLTVEPAADHFEPSDAWVAEVIELIAARAEQVSADGGDGSVKDQVRQELLSRRDRWSQAAEDHELKYTRYGLANDKAKQKEKNQRYLLGPAEEDHDGFFEAPGSLREVEGEVFVYLSPEALK